MRKLWLTATLLSSACQQLAPGDVQAPPDSASGEISFELAGPNDAALLVPVMINGQGPYDFVVDTGATLTCIDQALADSLNVKPLPGAFGLGAGATSAGRLRLVQIDTLTIGEATATDLPACVLDLTHIQDVGFAASGLLGLNFLRSFRVTLDFDRSILILQDPS